MAGLTLVFTACTPAHVHSWGAWSQAEDSTATDASTTARTCSGCSETETQILSSAGLEFAAIGETSFKVTGYTGTDTIVYIPSTRGGKPVTEIANNAFEGELAVTTITFTGENELEKIGATVFRDCKKLQSINLPATVTEIGEYAFDRCESLVSIELPAGLTLISDYLFRGCNKLETVKIADGSEMTEIGMYAFDGCESLKNLNTQAGLEIIGTYAFQNCSAFEKIVLPISVTKIDAYAFFGCESLTIYAEAASRPYGWNANSWNQVTRTDGEDCPVEWEYVVA
jgi:hypothetical protein